jgi:hypothetical protein
VSSTVGPLTLPVAAGSSGERFADPAVDALLSFLAFWLKECLDAKLANLSGTSSDAVPAANRFAFNPIDPRGHHVRLPIPALFVWWEGKSRVEKRTTVFDHRIRDLSVLYVFDDLPQMAEMERRVGLMNAVDTAFHKAAERGRHADYGTGSMLAYTIADVDAFSFEYLGGESGRFSIDDSKDKDERTFPCLRGSFTVRELIGADEPEEYLVDVLVTVRAGEGHGDAVDLMDRVLDGPDGSEEDE